MPGKSHCKLCFYRIQLGPKLTNRRSTEQLKSTHSGLLEKLRGGTLPKDVEEEMKKIIKAHVEDFTS